jgi:serine/threonine-protein kinase
VDEGLVTRSDPASGEEVEPGSTVTIFVSSGPGTVVVPDVTCQSFGSAQSDLRSAGFEPIRSSETRPVNPVCTQGSKVAAQEPAGGTMAEVGSQVFLFAGEEPISTGPTGPTGETGE